MKTIANSIVFDELAASLNRGERGKVRLVGESMYPFLLNKRDVLTIEPKGNRKLMVGDIVLFIYVGNYILHRIVRIEDDNRFVMQGDAICTNQEVTGVDDIIGVLSQVKRDGDTIINCQDWKWRWKGMAWIKLRFIRGKLLKVLKIIGK